MKNPLTKQEQQLFLMYLKKLSATARKEAFDFIGYLLAKTETEEEATAEILNDKKMLTGLKKGLKQIENGEVSDVAF